LTRATGAGCGAIVLWALQALLVRDAAAIPPFALVALTFAVAGIAGLAWLAATGRLHETRQRPSAWLHGVGGLFGSNALYFAALSIAPAAEANLLNYTWPLMLVALSAATLGLRLTRWHSAGVALAALGCVLLLADGARFTEEAVFGYALALSGALLWAVYCVLCRRFQAVPSGALAGFYAGAAVLAGLCHALFEPAVTLDARAWALVLLIGLGPVGGALYLWDTGMKYGDLRVLGTLAYATPVLSTLCLVAGGFAPLTMFTLAAAILVATGGMIATRGPAARPILTDPV
jgi:drug/metabolite transporter (DMT)-like permease